MMQDIPSKRFLIAAVGGYDAESTLRMLAMRLVYGLPMSSIAGAHGVTERAVYYRLRAARRRLDELNQDERQVAELYAAITEHQN